MLNVVGCQGLQQSHIVKTGRIIRCGDYLQE